MVRKRIYHIFKTFVNVKLIWNFNALNSHFTKNLKGTLFRENKRCIIAKFNPPIKVLGTTLDNVA